MGLAFTIISWIVSIYLFCLFNVALFSDRIRIGDSDPFLLLASSALFLVMPFAQTLKLGSLFEFSAKQIEKVAAEVKDFKEETRGLIAAQMSVISTVTTAVNQQVNVYPLPSPAEAEQAKEALEEVAKNQPSPEQISTLVHEILRDPYNDTNLILAKLRMDLESELRRILNRSHNVSFVQSPRPDVKYISLRSLFNRFLTKIPGHNNMEPAFMYVLEVCNAATHGRYISPSQANETLSMGLRILEELQAISAVDDAEE